MNKREVSNLLLDYFTNFKVNKLGLFGSFRRGEECSGSDIDILISFGEPIGLLQFIGIEQELTELIGKKVDLVSDRAITNQKLKDYIYQDLEVIYEKG